MFKTKYDEKGRETRCKARLVAKGFDQRFGTDFDETFAPVVKHTTIRAFLAAAAYKNMKVHHVEIKTAFLHGKLKEEIYMKQPEGFEEKNGKVCKLQKSLYGLKQAAKSWNEEIAETLVKQDFIQSKTDSCLFTKKNEENPVYIILYVDDMLICSKKDSQISEIEDFLKQKYEITNLGEVKFFLGIEICRTKDGSFLLNQKTKIEELVTKLKLENSKPTYTPMETGYYKLEGEKDQLEDNTKYRQAVGSLLYISTITRPDIAVSTHILSRRCEKPRERDWTAIKRVIRYLNTTKDLNLRISSGELPDLKVYCDADWAQDKQDRKSTSGNIVFIGNSCISWKSRKQNSVTLSSTEAEYVSLAQACQELIWIISLTEDLGLEQKLPIKIMEDNQSAIKISQSEKHNSRVKHIDVKYHYIRELQKQNIVEVDYCPSQQMISDMLTKPLPKPSFEMHRNAVNLIPAPQE